MGRTPLAILASIVTFAFVAAAILRFMPEPVQQQDYLIAGSMAALGGLFVLLLALVFTRGKAQEIFFKKRPKR